MKKRVLPLAGLMIVTLALLAAGQARREQTPPAIHTLRVALWDYDTVTYDRKVVEQFQKEHPDIRIEIISSPPAYYNDSLEAMLDSGERVDVIFVNQLSQLPVLLADQAARPLDAWVERDGIDLSRYPDVSVLRQPETGELVALPYRKDQFVLYYNKDLFDLAGLPYPENGMTWDDFYDTAAALTERLKPIDADYWGAYFLKKEMHLFYFLRSAPFQWAWDDFESIRPGLSLLLQMRAEGLIPPFSRAALAQDSQRLFERGNYGMFVHGSWYMNFLSMDEARGLVDFAWGAVERPVWSAASPNQNDAWVTPVVIHRDTTEAEAAWTFVKYVCGEEGARILAEEQMLPAYQSDEIDAILADNLTQRGISPDLFARLSDPVQPPSQQQEELADAVYAQYGRALLLLDGVEESIAAMEQARERFLEMP